MNNSRYDSRIIFLFIKKRRSAMTDVVEIEPHLYLTSYSGLCHIFPDEESPQAVCGPQPRSSQLKRVEHIVPSSACVLTVDTRRLPSTLTKKLADYKFVRSQDDASADLLTYFDEVHAFIARALSNDRNVIVHCNAGVSRSSTLICAYLMKSRGLDLQQALALIQRLKSDVMPNENFRCQLNLYSKMGLNVNTQSHDFRQYRLKVFAKQSAYQRPGADGLAELLWPRPRLPSTVAGNSTNISTVADAGADMRHCDVPTFVPTTTPGDVVDSRSSTNMLDANEIAANTVYSSAVDIPPITDTAGAGDQICSCRMCRVSLYRTSGLMLHTRTIPLSSAKSDPVDSSSASGSASDSPTTVSTICAEEFYIEPVDWMRDQITGVVEGKLYCFKCGKKIGNFSWIGERCACATWVQPAFHIHRTKVDFRKDIKADKANCGRQIM